MIYAVGKVLSFNHLGKKRYGVIDVVKSDSLWVNQVAYKGGYVCKIEDIIKYYDVSIRDFRDKFPECNI